MAIKASNSYKDLNLTFAMHPITKDLTVLKDEDAIKRAVLNLFAYEAGEKFFNPDFGSNIRKLLFEPVDFVSAGFIQDEARRLIATYEPRIRILDLTVVADPDNNSFEMQLQYNIPDKSQKLFAFNLTLLSLAK